MKILRTIVILALVAGLVLGGVSSSAFAKKPPDVPRGGGPHSPGKRGLVGTVSSVDEVTDNISISIYLETKLKGVDETVHITANVTANYMVPTETHGATDLAGFLEIVDEDGDGEIEELVGRRLAALVTFTNELEAYAIRLMLIPDAPLHLHRVGVVLDFTAGTGGSIKIIGSDNVTYTFEVSVDTIYRPHEIADFTKAELEAEIIDRCVTVVTKGDPKKADLEAKAIVLHKKIPGWWP